MVVLKLLFVNSVLLLSFWIYDNRIDYMKCVISPLLLRDLEIEDIGYDAKTGTGLLMRA